MDESLRFAEENDREFIWKKLNWRLCLKASDMQEEFFQFCRSNKLNSILLSSIFYFGFLVVPFNIMTLFFNQSSGGVIFSFLNIILGVAMVYSGWSIYWDSKVGKEAVIRLHHMIQIFGIYLYFILCIYRGFFLETCSGIPPAVQGFVVGWHCGYNYLNIPPYSLPALALCPLVTLLTLNETRTDIILVGQLFSTVFFVSFAVIGGNMTIVWCTIITTIFTFVVCLELHISRVGNFLSYKKLQATLIENQRMQEQNKATELRNMIGNLAHDLKTPLSSFVAGIDLIGHTLQDMEEGVREIDNTLPIHEAITTMTQCFKNIRNTHSFMLMAINRCIDYTKASRGLTLVPKNETIDMMETLAMPLECISNIQERVDVHILPVSSNICSHIITDKQWLQENLLCLLSNAIKYSSSGTATIAVELVTNEEENDYIDDGICDNKSSKGSLPHSTSQLSLFSSNLLENLSQKQIHPVINLTTEYSDISSFSSAAVCRQRLRFAVEDNGIGMTEEAMKDLFNPFQRAQSLAGGTGLGLYSLAMRMDAIKGRYGVQARRDGKQGSLFWFEVPYRPDVASALMQNGNPSLKVSLEKFNFEPFRVTLKKQLEILCSPEKKKLISVKNVSSEEAIDSYDSNANSLFHDSKQLVFSLSSATPLPAQSVSRSSSFRSTAPALSIVTGSWKILLVDDSPPILKMVKLMLKHQGHEVELAENGQIALEKIEQQSKHHGKGFDVILMDLQMPVMDGLEATKRIRYNEQSQKQRNIMPIGIAIPAHQDANTAKEEALDMLCARQVIIGMSANSDHETMQQILSAGANDFIAKPFHVDVFTRTALKYINTS